MFVVWNAPPFVEPKPASGVGGVLADPAPVTKTTSYHKVPSSFISNIPLEVSTVGSVCSNTILNMFPEVVFSTL